MRKGLRAILGLCTLALTAMPALAQESAAAVLGPPTEINVRFTPDAACPSRIWGNVDYLLWWYRSGPLTAPLVTSGSDLDQFPTVIGQPGTNVLFGGSDLTFGGVNGLRFSGGFNFDCDGRWGIEAGALVMERSPIAYQVASDGAGVPTLGRPFVRLQSGAENSLLISSALFAVAGDVAIAASSRLEGWEVNLAANSETDRARCRWLIGYRNLNLYESTGIQQNVSDISGGFSVLAFQGNQVSAPSSLAIVDSFHASNRFHGGQIGGRFDWDLGRFSVNVLGKIGLGSTRQVVSIDGNTAVLTPGADSISAPGGLLAQTSNIGRYSRDVFTVVPEVNLNFGYRLTNAAQLRVGYSFLYWSSVVRPGDAIDRTVNSSLINADQRFGSEPGASRPAFAFRGSDFWAHGFNFGLEFRY